MDPLSPITRQVNKDLRMKGTHWFVSEVLIACHQPGWDWWKERCKMQHVLDKSLTRAEIDALGKAAQWVVTCEIKHLSTCFLWCDCLSPVLRGWFIKFVMALYKSNTLLLGKRRKWYIKSQWLNCFWDLMSHVIAGQMKTH